MINAALVLEGGSLRSLYTAGVLDVFIENKIEFSCVIGVSAGALTAANYITKQKYRSAKINILHSNNPHYYGMYQLFTKGNAFNFEYLFHNPINNIYPYDIKALYETKQRFLIGATDCETGKPVYFENKSNYESMIQYLRASSSIPLLADMVKINDRQYLDGGIADPIGITKAIEEKYNKIVVILTRDLNFSRTKEAYVDFLLKFKYKKYPNLLKTLNEMDSKYNHLKGVVEGMERKGDIFVIRPQKEVKIRRMEKRSLKLIDLYFQGIEDAGSRLEELYSYLNREC